MDNRKDIRWKQRFANFKKAFAQLTEAVERIDVLSQLEKEGLVQRFEYTFELGWKTLKDYLESKGIDAKYPRDVIKESFRNELIDDGEVWLEMLAKRNAMAHAYDEEVFNEAVREIGATYYDRIKHVYGLLENAM
jgi:nucleotidyltransferase substrate binding protein (TIGR01987 family)